MTNQKVIEFLERKKKRAHPCDIEYYDRAIFALRENIEREKGCEYCKYDGCELCLNKGDMTICEDCADNAWTYCNHYKKSYFCRRCGRKLKPEDAE